MESFTRKLHLPLPFFQGKSMHSIPFTMCTWYILGYCDWPVTPESSDQSKRFLGTIWFSWTRDSSVNIPIQMCPVKMVTRRMWPGIRTSGKINQSVDLLVQENCIFNLQRRKEWNLGLAKQSKRSIVDNVIRLRHFTACRSKIQNVWFKPPFLASYTCNYNVFLLHATCKPAQNG